jgi:hypothetical protein
MRTRIVSALATATLVSFAFAAVPASAKTVKECQTAWRADKAAGKTEKAYVAECRGVAAAAAKPAAAGSPPKVKEDKGGY